MREHQVLAYKSLIFLLICDWPALSAHAHRSLTQRLRTGLVFFSVPVLLSLSVRTVTLFFSNPFMGAQFISLIFFIFGAPNKWIENKSENGGERSIILSL